MFLANCREPILPTKRIYIFRHRACWSVPICALPTGSRAKYSVMLLESSIERRFACRSRCFELSMRPMHRVEQSEALGDTVVKIAPIDLEWMKAGDIELGQIHGRFPPDDPLGQGLADA